MCTYIVEKALIAGSGKGANGWFDVTQANITYDHPSHAFYEHTLNIDFVNEAEGPGARVAVELTAESARAVAEKILAALEAGKDADAGSPGSTGAVMALTNAVQQIVKGSDVAVAAPVSSSEGDQPNGRSRQRK